VGDSAGRKTAFFKLVVDRQTDRILSCHIIGERAVNIAQVATIAIAPGILVDRLTRIPLSFPTYTGIPANVAACAARKINNQSRKKIPVTGTAAH